MGVAFGKESIRPKDPDDVEKTPMPLYRATVNKQEDTQESYDDQAFEQQQVMMKRQMIEEQRRQIRQLQEEYAFLSGEMSWFKIKKNY